MHPAFESILQALPAACTAAYGERLVSLAVFGAVARGVPRADSDVDPLVVARDLPRGRIARVREFEAVEAGLSSDLRRAVRAGIPTTVAPVLKTPEEVERGSPLSLDMTEEVVILVDRDHYLRGYLDRLRSRLATLGARRIRKTGGYSWLRKPDYRPGDRIEP